MPVMSVTRLRVRALRYLPAFAWYAFQSKRQLSRSPGFLGGALAPAPSWTFWTTSAWVDEASMKRFRDTAWHKRAMPRLLDYCNEASLARWTQDTADLPTSPEMLERLKTSGRISKVRHPTAGQAAGQTVPDGHAPRPGLPVRPHRP
jgi:hypothetical protein